MLYFYFKVFIINNHHLEKKARALRELKRAPAGVAQWIGCWPAKKTVTGSIPSQGTCLGCQPGPQWEACQRQPPIDVSLSPSPPLSLKTNK